MSRGSTLELHHRKLSMQSGNAENGNTANQALHPTKNRYVIFLLSIRVFESDSFMVGECRHLHRRR